MKKVVTLLLAVALVASALAVVAAAAPTATVPVNLFKTYSNGLRYYQGTIMDVNYRGNRELLRGTDSGALEVVSAKEDDANANPNTTYVAANDKDGDGVYYQAPTRSPRYSDNVPQFQFTGFSLVTDPLGVGKYTYTYYVKPTTPIDAASKEAQIKFQGKTDATVKTVVLKENDWTEIKTVIEISQNGSDWVATVEGQDFVLGTQSNEARLFITMPKNADDTTKQIGYLIDDIQINKEGLVTEAPATPTPTATPTPPATPTPEVNNLINLLEEVGDYPKINVSDSRYGIKGSILNFAGDVGTASVSLIKNGVAGYDKASDLDGNGYLLVTDRQSKWGGFTGPCFNLNTLANIYGEGTYTVKVSVKLASGESAEAYLHAQALQGAVEGGNVVGEKKTVVNTGYTELVMTFKIVKIDDVFAVTSQDGVTVAKMDPSKANRILIMVDKDKNVYYDQFSLTEPTHTNAGASATPTAPATPTPTPKPLENLLVSIGDAPALNVSDSRYGIKGSILQYAGSPKAELSFLTKGGAGYAAENDPTGNGYLLIKKRDNVKANLQWGTSYTGPCLNLNAIADIYGEGTYTFKEMVKLASGGAYDAFCKIEIDPGTGKQWEGEKVEVTNDGYAEISISFKIVKNGGEFYIENLDGSKSYPLPAGKANRVLGMVDENLDVMFTGFALTEASHYARDNNNGGNSSTTGDVNMLAPVFTLIAVVSGAAAVVAAKKKKEN